MRFSLVVNVSRPKALKVAEALIQWFKARGIDFLVEKQAAKLLNEKGKVKKEELAEKSDIIITLGGDGTILEASRYARGKPILGVNLGRLGFLAEFSVDEMHSAIERALKGDFKTEHRTQLEASVKTGKKEKRFIALNDVIIEKGGYPRLPIISLRIDGSLLTDYKADGLIISTSTGSTAYNMSAGGPIIVPKSRVFAITPICPHMLTVRPIIISDDKELEIAVETPSKNFVLNCDGAIQLALSPKTRVRVRKSDKPAILIANEKRNYYDVLRQKFLWGRDHDA
ncbi:MAG: NAD(+)/NADH kinase [Chloroherpetonaceae bacterium]|nr:NAD(+)/NADH kinase [Chloroherpetonaceae bacterium]MDW8437037.1 NAD(+)/NADH kinase [Chloroherpetonaceae bacterium]